MPPRRRKQKKAKRRALTSDGKEKETDARNRVEKFHERHRKKHAPIGVPTVADKVGEGTLLANFANLLLSSPPDTHH
ncbi:hypothetical protein pipiens_014466 [Culex pipiens pipiens]|uniref:Uncharacterized protein n=1 Tax=Culex pipiens pipiens TaxID=38569 RepID=A0ABD1CUF4_CULPP